MTKYTVSILVDGEWLPALPTKFTKFNTVRRFCKKFLKNTASLSIEAIRFTDTETLEVWELNKPCRRL